MMQENAVSESPLEPSFVGARHFLGFGDRKGGALIAPSLHAHVASELGKAASILKEKRKADEARSSSGRGRGRGDKSGRGRGNGGEGAPAPTGPG